MAAIVVAVCEMPRSIVVILSIFANTNVITNAHPMCRNPVSAEPVPAMAGGTVLRDWA